MPYVSVGQKNSERVYEKAVGWRRTLHRGVRPTESLGRFGGPRLDESRLGATLRQSDDLFVHALRTRSRSSS